MLYNCALCDNQICNAEDITLQKIETTTKQVSYGTRMAMNVVCKSTEAHGTLFTGYAVDMYDPNSLASKETEAVIELECVKCGAEMGWLHKEVYILPKAALRVNA